MQENEGRIGVEARQGVARRQWKTKPGWNRDAKGFR